MNVNPDIDLTPETARSLDRFRMLFRTGRFVWIAKSWTDPLGATDLEALYRVLDCVVACAAGHNLCSLTDAPSPEQAAAQARDQLAHAVEALSGLQGVAEEWYASQTPEVQAAVIELLEALSAWAMSAISKVPPETFAVLYAARDLIDLLVAGFSAGRRR